MMKFISCDGGLGPSWPEISRKRHQENTIPQPILTPIRIFLRNIIIYQKLITEFSYYLGTLVATLSIP